MNCSALCLTSTYPVSVSVSARKTNRTKEEIRVTNRLSFIGMPDFSNIFNINIDFNFPDLGVLSFDMSAFTQWLWIDWGCATEVTIILALRLEGLYSQGLVIPSTHCEKGLLISSPYHSKKPRAWEEENYFLSFAGAQRLLGWCWRRWLQLR